MEKIKIKKSQNIDLLVSVKYYSNNELIELDLIIEDEILCDNNDGDYYDSILFKNEKEKQEFLQSKKDDFKNGKFNAEKKIIKFDEKKDLTNRMENL